MYTFFISANKRVVTLIFTYHSRGIEGKTNQAGKDKIKSMLVYDYSIQMRGVDMWNWMLNGFLLERKGGLNWQIKLFKRLSNISVGTEFLI